MTTRPKFKVYSRPSCHWCIKAIELLKKVGLEYEKITVGEDISREDFIALVGPGILTVPQVFAYNRRIGGYEDLASFLENHGNYGHGEL